MKAFPLKDINPYSDQEGMDLQDYFAAKAMHAAIVVVGNDMKADPYEEIAYQAYKFADAMIKARNK